MSEPKVVAQGAALEELACALRAGMPGHIPVEKEERRQGLVLSGSANVLLFGEVQQKTLHRTLTQIVWMLLVVEENEAPDPSTICLLGASTVVLEAQALPYGVE